MPDFPRWIAMFGIATLLATPIHAQSNMLRVMSYNVRYASDTPPNAWPDRLPVAKAMLEQYQPDVIGMQEALYRQVKDFATALPAYAWIGLGREGGSHGEFMAVFYRTDRLEPLEFDHFWLSDTPEVIGSSTWGNSNRRMVTWVLFRDRRTNQDFYFINTHFDHEIQLAREKSAELLLGRARQLQDLPVLLTGDFNAPDGGEVYRTLVSDDGFADSWATAQKRGDQMGTFHGYRPANPNGPRIDWILTRGPVKSLYSEIVTFQRGGQYPSDHFPVISDVQFDR